MTMEITDCKRALRRVFCVSALLLALAFAAGGPQASFAVQEDVLYYTLNGNNATITRCATTATDTEVAAAFTAIAGEGYTVTAIGDSAFFNCAGLTSIVIPGTVESIGGYAFYGCAALTEITVDAENHFFMSDAGILFDKEQTTLLVYPRGSALHDYTIPSKVTSIGEAAFSDCTSLASVTIPGSVESIGDAAFSGCTGLASLTIPGSVNIIGEVAFGGCIGLGSVTIPGSVESIGYAAFYDCTGLASVTIADGVESIGDTAFSNCTSLASVTIPGSVESIGESAFSNCTSLGSVTIPGGVASISEAAFSGCTDLASVTIPGSVESIGAHAFSGCTDLASATISEGVTSIGDSAFEGCSSLASITIPGSVESIGGSAFEGCSSLASVTISEGVTSIGDRAFYNCWSLTSIVFPAGVTSIGDQAFYNCMSLTGIVLPAGLTSIGDFAFGYCENLASIVLPAGLTSIGDSAFYGCAVLESITIPGSVESIGSGAFHDCAALTGITVDAGNPSFMSDAGILFDKAKTTLLVYPAGSALHDYTVPSGVTSIGEGAFYACTGLTNINIPAGVASIGDSAFSHCIGLESVVLPSGVTSIGDRAFYNCWNLTSIVFPAGVTSIGDFAFGYCENLASIVLPSGLTSIGDSAFRDCGNLVSIVLPSGVASIGDRAFYYCLRLTSIVLPSSVTHIGAGAFGGSGIAELRIPASVATMGGEGPFSDMRHLRQIVFPHGRTAIPANTLRGNFYKQNGENVKIYVPLSVVSVDPGAIDLSPSDNITVCGVEGSYIEQWAIDNGVGFEGIEAAITKTDYDEAYRLVPYQYIIETDTPENAGLSFEVVGGSLPAGQELLQTGQFHGAPLETGEFAFRVAIHFALFGGGGEKEYLMDLQEIRLRVDEPDDGMLEGNNLYPIDAYIGESQDPSGKGDYVLAGPWGLVGDREFRIEDIDPDGPGGPEEAENNFPFFADFWVDGHRLTSGPAISGADYDAREGSTIVTVYAKTFQNLDNGPHTIAAEFMLPDPDGGPSVSKVAAQKFTLELTVEKPPAPPVSGPSGGRPSAAAPAAVPDAAPAVAPPAAQAAAWQNPFGDVDAGAWYYADVAYVCENNLMNGTSATGFDPGAPMTRGMLVTVLHRAAGSPAPPEGGGAAFTELPAGASSAEAAAWAAASGILTGAGDGRAAPLADISRQDLAALLARYAEFADRAPPAVRPAAGFADEAGVADYAREAVRTLAAAGVLNGKPGNLFDPQGKATRAEVAAVLHRFLEAAE
jgi:hypothetical protein